MVRASTAAAALGNSQRKPWAGCTTCQPVRRCYWTMCRMARSIDGLDARLVALLAGHPRIGVLELARRLGVARGTVQARLDRLTGRGVIRGFGPDIAPAAL